MHFPIVFLDLSFRWYKSDGYVVVLGLDELARTRPLRFIQTDAR